MEINEKFIKANEFLQYNISNNKIPKKIYGFRDVMHKEDAIKMYLEAGVSPIIIKEKFCEYFWAIYFKDYYSSKLSLKESQERSRVAPSDFGMQSIEYLKFMKEFWEKERLSIEKLLLSNLTDNKLSEDEMEKVVQKIFETIKSQDEKIIAKCKAMERYINLSKLSQIKEKILGKAPQKIDFESISIEKIDTLYGGKKK